MLAQKFSPGMNPVGMWVSEKLDGVRAIFADGKFYSRSGNVFHAPKWFVDAMPRNIALDGELFTKRGDFQRVMGIVRKNTPVDDEWRHVKYMVFDLPNPTMAFEDRYESLKAIVRQASTPFLVLVENTIVKSRDQLDDLHNRVLAKGGEGLMLRIPGSLYEHKRSSNLLKLKKDDDDEAVVIGHEFGQGKNAHVLGKLVVRWKHATQPFHVGGGFTDKQRREYKKLFPIGTMIKIKHHGMTGSKKPRFPIFVGVRDPRDIS